MQVELIMNCWGEYQAKGNAEMSSWSEMMDDDLLGRGHGGLTELVEELSKVVDERPTRVDHLVRRLSGRTRELSGEMTCNVMMEALLRCPKMLNEVFRRLNVVPVPVPSKGEVDKCSLMAGLANVQRDQSETLGLILEALRKGGRPSRDEVAEIRRESREDYQAVEQLCALMEGGGI
jgi:hypothetical protein